MNRAVAAAEGPLVAVVDIGSNSVRLVVFAGPPAAPLPKFNEKVLCGLGRRLSETGRLDDAAMHLALKSMRRFTALARRMQVSEFQVVATSAVRDAENGPEFVAEVERCCDLKVRVLTGRQEAEFSGMGVISGIPQADGVMGDLGGGSLELVELQAGQLGESVSLPLGPFRLQNLPPSEARQQIDRALEALPWLSRLSGRPLYLVGGAWRAIARIHMAQSNYPLRIIHHYRIGPAQAEEIARLLARQSRNSLLRIEGVPRKRIDTLPLAAMVLRRLLRRLGAADVVFSAHGLREGLRYAVLTPEQRGGDPLIAACREMAEREGRFGEHGDELAAFIAPLFPGDGAEDRRQTLAACLLSDVAWRVNPEYRGEQAFRRILRAPFAGIDHPGRARVALAVFARYQGNVESEHTLPGRALLDQAEGRKALIIGLALRLAHTLSAGTAGVLSRMRLVSDERRLTLEVGRDMELLVGEVVQRRLDALAKVRGQSGLIRIVSK